jgi:hypothetical protein
VVYLKGFIGPLCETCDYFGETWGGSFYRSDPYICKYCSKFGLNNYALIIYQIGVICLLTLFVSISKNGLMRLLTVEYLRYINLF